jgi:hypothetical protein
MKEPRVEIEIINKVINQQISEEEFFKNGSDSGGRLILDMPELEYAKRHPAILREFLNSLSIEGRFKVLLTKELLGMPQKSFISKYGIPIDSLRLLKGQHNVTRVEPKPELRRIIQKGQPKLEVTAAIAVMARIPMDWLREQSLKSIWNVTHFHLLPQVNLSPKEFLDYLKNIEIVALSENAQTTHTRPKFSYVYDVRAIILNLDSKSVYLRSSVYEQGGFIIELFGNHDQLDDFLRLKNVLKSFEPLEVGYCETVIEDHINMMIIVKSQANNFSYPIEFRRF